MAGSSNESYDAIVSQVRQVVLRHFQLNVATIVLCEEGALPKTTSGKLQRSLIKKLMVADGVPGTLLRSDAATEQKVVTACNITYKSCAFDTGDAISKEWLRSAVVEAVRTRGPSVMRAVRQVKEDPLEMQTIDLPTAGLSNATALICISDRPSQDARRFVVSLGKCFHASLKLPCSPMVCEMASEPAPEMEGRRKT